MSTTPVSSAEAPVTLLTGAASGIGRHLATILSARGHRLLLADIDQAGLLSLAEKLGVGGDRVLTRQLDVRSLDDWHGAMAELIQRWGRIDVLLNVAGVVRPGLVHESTPDDVAYHLDINAKGLILGSQLAAQRMVAQRSGHIINFASMAALAAVPGIALYSASKFAVRGFSLALAHELRPHGVAVTVICPDAVQTPMLDLQLDYPQAALTFSGKRPLTVEDLGKLVVDRVLPRRPVEATLPRYRGWMAKVSSLTPSLALAMLPGLTKQGLRRQAAAKAAYESQYGRRQK